MDNIDDEYKRLVEHLHDCTSKAKSFKTTKKRLSPKTPELIRQRGAARAAGNQELTSVLARLCREAIKEDLKEGRAESEPQPYRVPHDHETNCCPIISELSADSFVDSKLFVNPKEDPASQTFPMKSCLVFDDAKLNSFCVGSESSSERKFGLRELEELPGSDTVISRMPRRRAPPPSFSPPEPREIKRRRKLKLAYGSRTVVRGDGTFECKIPGCGKILHFKQSCRRQGLDHVRSHFPKKTRRCKICDYSGNTNASVYNHHTSCHSSTPYPGPVAADMEKQCFYSYAISRKVVSLLLMLNCSRTKEDLELLQRLFSQAFPEIPGIESYMSVIS
ncbi:hypothetical protein NECAME_00958 [Necator americanus]|uniref:Uncharacterized protein n=1 Tax=Necator americanus TaxID=51031 RepID=W2SK75_NECAM|nr:hypothetical protein NECAME_00958 [Necator americanus]ETN70010.1 hypothetical protein NECAME_00958 [Necator americanus]